MIKLDYNNLTSKQVSTLIMFAKGFPIYIIASEHSVCNSTISSRIERIKRKAPSIFERAVSIRRANKRLKENLKSPESINNFTDKELSNGCKF